MKKSVMPHATCDTISCLQYIFEKIKNYTPLCFDSFANMPLYFKKTIETTALTFYLNFKKLKQYLDKTVSLPTIER